MKKVLIYTDDRKDEILLAERHRFKHELNRGLEILKKLPFVEPDQFPELEDLSDAGGFWDRCILEALKPRRVKGFKPSPKQLCLQYSINYDEHKAEINSIPWTAIDMVDFVDGEFQVTPKIEEQVKEISSYYSEDPEQIKTFEKLNVLLNHLNEYCDKHVSDKNGLNNIADALHCKYVQLPDRTHKIVPDYRVLLHLMNRGTSNP